MTAVPNRLEAAVKAWDHHWGDRYGDEALEEMGEEVQVALAAADEVMFSEEAIERAARTLDPAFDRSAPWVRAGLRQTVRTVIDALRAEA